MKSHSTFIDVYRTMAVCQIEQWHQQNIHTHTHALNHFLTRFISLDKKIYEKFTNLYIIQYHLKF